jgi:hypothetical protein
MGRASKGFARRAISTSSWQNSRVRGLSREVGASPLFFRWFKKRARPPNITVYYLSAITAEDSAKATPLGIVPRFSDNYERELKRKHRLRGATYFSDDINGFTATLAWTGKGVDAISFLSTGDARAALAGLKEFSADDLARLEGAFKHFPRTPSQNWRRKAWSS